MSVYGGKTTGLGAPERDLRPPGIKRSVTRRSFGIALGASIVTVAGGAGAAFAALSATGQTGNPGTATTFGTVAITQAERQARLPGGALGTSHSDHVATTSKSPQPVNMTFGDHLRLRLSVENTSGEGVLFSPGQLRLVLPQDGWTLANRGSDVRLAVVEAGATLVALISFLVPSDEAGFAAEFDDIGARGQAPLRLEVPGIVSRPGSLESMESMGASHG